MDYIIHIFILCGIYAILAISLDLLIGHTGLLSLAHAAFYAIGAYVSAILTTQLHISPLIAALLGVLLVIPLSLAVSIPFLRLHEDYFVIGTFGLQMILYNVLQNWLDVTRGALGISGIPQPRIAGWLVDSRSEFAILTIFVVCFSYICIRQIASSPFGRVLHAIREDEILPQSLGKDTRLFKVSAFAVSAVFAGLAGSLYAHYITYIDPTSFTVMESILIISMIIIGGPGSTWGPLVGAVALVVLPEGLRFLGLPDMLAANIRQSIYGLAIVLMMILRPKGLLGHFELE